MYTPTQRLMRSRNDRVIAGVASGIAQYLAIDPVLVRLAFIALIFTGVGILLYPVMWLIMPLEGGTGTPHNQALNEMRQQAQRMGDEIREVFVAPGSQPRRPRYDPMTGEPIDPEGEIPINNLNTGASKPDTQAQRNRLLGIVLLAVGGFILLTMIPGFGWFVSTYLVPILLIIGGFLLLRRGL